MPSFYERNKAWARPAESYQTPLSAENERRFANWLKLYSARVGEFNPSNPAEDYDMRGWWLENKGVAPPQGHFPDTYKTPYHESFSNESKYALPSAPRWIQNGNRWLLTDQAGRVVYAE